MASVVGICNRALQLLGAERVVTLADNSRNARACSAAYDAVRQAELRSHSWSFAVARAALAADADAPTWGRTNAFTLPADCLRTLPPYPEDNYNTRDWQIEGRKILADESAPLYLRYITDVEDPNVMDALFREALSAKLAQAMCEEITQSNVKKADAKDAYKDAIAMARKVNAFERVPAESFASSWTTARG